MGNGCIDEEGHAKGGKRGGCRSDTGDGSPRSRDPRFRPPGIVSVESSDVKRFRRAFDRFDASENLHSRIIFARMSFPTRTSSHPSAPGFVPPSPTPPSSFSAPSPSPSMTLLSSPNETKGFNEVVTSPTNSKKEEAALVVDAPSSAAVPCLAFAAEEGTAPRPMTFGTPVP